MKPRDLFPILAFLVCAHATSHAANTGGIEGTVVDHVNKVVGAGSVNIAVQCGTVRKSAAVDAAGHFSVGKLPAGSCTLTTSGALYVPATLGVTVADGSISTILVTVTTKAYMAEVRKQQAAQQKQWTKMSQRDRMLRPKGATAWGGGGGGMGVKAGRPGLARQPVPEPMPAPMEAMDAMEGAPPPMPRPARPAPAPAVVPAPKMVKPADIAKKPPLPAGATPVLVGKAKIVRIDGNDKAEKKK
ncbi:MAG: carboxypeptidase regulatory-like domain-containing protein, partial [Deltaproteobacteria bacterium]|nr:carboxypeptidase regulatory-like domain-containing protein [Deltaproteobacteria bacterium]